MHLNLWCCAKCGCVMQSQQRLKYSYKFYFLGSDSVAVALDSVVSSTSNSEVALTSWGAAMVLLLSRDISTSFPLNSGAASSKGVASFSGLPPIIGRETLSQVRFLKTPPSGLQFTF